MLNRSSLEATRYTGTTHKWMHFHVIGAILDGYTHYTHPGVCRIARLRFYCRVRRASNFRSTMSRWGTPHRDGRQNMPQSTSRWDAQPAVPPHPHAPQQERRSRFSSAPAQPAHGPPRTAPLQAQPQARPREPLIVPRDTLKVPPNTPLREYAAALSSSAGSSKVLAAARARQLSYKARLLSAPQT